MSLKDLDDRVLPAIGARVAALLDGRRRRGEPVATRPLAGPAPFIVRLRRLDDRFTSSGPLALFREVPQLAAVLIGAIVLASGIYVRAHHVPRRPPVTEPTPAPSETPADSGRLGPALGANVNDYVRLATINLQREVQGQPDGVAVAVLMFDSYLTPEAARDLAGVLPIRRVFFRAPLPLGRSTPQTIPVQDVVRDTRAKMRSLAKEDVAKARENRKVAATVENDPEAKADYLKDAASWEAEARLFDGSCPCVYAVVVQARLRLLLDRITAPGVRVIDVGRVGSTLGDYEFTALLPEEKRIVTGGNQS